MIKVITVIGARPQFVKAGIFSKYIKQQNLIKEVLVHTGQHYDYLMDQIFFKNFMLDTPKYKFKAGGLSHGEMIAEIIVKLESVFIKEKPDWVLLYGDTNSTLAAAIAADKKNIKICHVESGLRSYNNSMPEETNRILTDRVSKLLICPTEQAIDNLIQEGYNNFECKFTNCGDIMYEAFLNFQKFLKKPNLKINRNYSILTLHRQENVDEIDYLNQILSSISKITKHKEIIFPVHPRTLNKIRKHQINTKNIKLIDPTDYFEMLWLLRNCDSVITDSGGLQKEAYFSKKPCFILRKETEWTELTKNNNSVLVGKNISSISDLFFDYKFNDDFSIQFFGNGSTSSLIANEILSIK